jgi:lipoate-protein ligase A
VRWHLWLDEAHAGPVNMARDEALLEIAAETGNGVLRIYRWAPFTLSFGAHEPALRRYDRDRIEALGLPVVRRPTGGRAVWHAEELTYAVAAPESAFGSLTETYHAIHTAIADALRGMGASVTLARRPAAPPALEDGACFASPIGGEIVAGGRKAVGSAQLRRGGAFLQHGSILLSGSQDIVNDVTRGAPPEGGEITLADVLGRRVDPAAVASALTRAARDAWLGDWDDGGPLAGRAAALAERHVARFASEEWTWRR